MASGEHVSTSTDGAAARMAGAGPLKGVKVVEFGSIGPGPFAAMLLADLGADVIRLDRPSGGMELATGRWNVMNRGRPSVGVNLKHPDAVELALELLEDADALIEGLRPGVMEKIGLGPDVVHARNPRVVYGRMTGYGQQGPMASVAGHDINYISLGGALGSIGRPGERPQAPLNLVGDFGGGGMLLAFGVVAALLEARTSGQGQVVDAAMVDGTATLMTMMFAMRGGGMWQGPAGTNLLDGGAPFYDTYETKDGKFVAVGAIEPQFYAELLRLLEIPAEEMPQYDVARWGEFKQRLADTFATKTRDEWAAIMEPAETCTTGIYTMDEVISHPHMVARGTFVEQDGVVQPNVSPRFSRTPGQIGAGPGEAGGDTDAALAAWGVSEQRIAELREAGALGG